MKKILLIVPPFFTPFAPPLGASLLKSFLQKRGYQVRCIDLNVNPELWDTHHKYFEILDKIEGNQLDGYSLYWYILNPHMLTYANGGSIKECNLVVKSLCEKYTLKINDRKIDALTKIVEDYFANLQRFILKECEIEQYDFVGTSTYSTSLASALYIHKVVKSHHPHITTMMGGGVFADDLAMGSENFQTLVREYPYIDKIVVGEGELLFLKILQGEFADQRVVSLQDIDNQTLEINESLAPDFSDFDLDDYYHVTIEGSRSCPFQCKFCSERIQWGPYRKKDASLLGNQLISLCDTFNVNTFFLGDSLINLYVQDLSKHLVDMQAELFFDGYLRAEKPVTVRENTRLWSKAGLYRVRLGMESASPHVLELMNKKITPDNMRECLVSLSNAGVRPTTYWVVGFPGETEEDFQETLDFVKENYRHIYELEAHPYYYYPTNQGASSDYSYQSLYTAEVEKLVKFKKYDIVNPVPSRQERFDRLRRISDLSKELGLINIYSLLDIYKAEERWISLYPAAREIYEGTRFNRDVIPSYPYSISATLPVDSPWSKETFTYSISIQEEVDQVILAQACTELVQYQEMLATCFVERQGGLEPMVNHGQVDLNVETYAIEGEEVEQKIQEIAQSLANSITLHNAPLVKVGLIQLAETSYKLLLVGNKFVCDPESLAIMAEDLYRLYRQRSLNLPVSLKPQDKLYREFIAEQSKKGVVTWARGVQGPKGHLIRTETGLSHHDSDLHIFGLTPADVITLAVMKTLQHISGQNIISIDLAQSYRWMNDDVKNVMGPLGITYGFTYEFHEEEPIAGLKRFKKSVQEPKTSIDPSASKVLLNYRYLKAQAWLGGDSWKPEGVVLDSQNLEADYLVELVPTMSGETVGFWIRYVAIPEAEELVQGLQAQLNDQIQAITQGVKAYSRDKHFYLNQFTEYKPTKLLQPDFMGKVVEIARVTGVVGEAVQAQVKTIAENNQSTLHSVYFAVWNLLLSKHADRTDLAILDITSLNEIYPIRTIMEQVPFHQYIRMVDQLIRRTHTHGHGLQVLAEHNLMKKSLALTDVGYMYQDATHVDVIGSINDAHHLTISLVLKASLDTMEIEYRSDLLEAESVQYMLHRYLDLLKNITNDIEKNIADIEWTSEVEDVLVKNVDTEEFALKFDF